MSLLQIDLYEIPNTADIGNVKSACADRWDLRTMGNCSNSVRPRIVKVVELLNEAPSERVSCGCHKTPRL